jgi:hypothetical protein
VTRYFAWATAAAATAFALVAILLLTTTTGYGCEDGCGRYERMLMWTGPILFWLFVVGCLVTVGLWLVRRRFAKPS